LFSWSVKNSFFPGAVVGLVGGRIDVEYDDGDEGTCDLAKEEWRLEE